MKLKLKNIALLSLLALSTTGCTGNFEDMNTNPIATTEVAPALLLTYMQDYGFVVHPNGNYQLGCNLYANDYTQYVSNTASYFPSNCYTWKDGWAKGGFWNPYYTYLAKPLHETGDMLAAHPEYSNIYQMMRILSAIGAARTTDIFGDVPYFEASVGNATPVYDAQKDIYYDIFKELTEATNALAVNADQTDPGTNDLIFGGDVTKWIKLANSCRLRYAMRLRFIDPDKSKTEAEAALQTNMIASNDDNAGVTTSDIAGHQLYCICFWNEFRASKTMIDMMLYEGSVIDPRISLWFSKTQSWQYGDEWQDSQKTIPVIEWQGVPNGRNTFVNEYSTNNNSCVWGSRAFPGWNSAEKGSIPTGTTAVVYNNGSPNVPIPMVIFNYSEICFLKAEAALYGYSNAGDAKTNYEAGIRASFAEARSVVNSKYYSTNDDDAYINGGDVKWGTDTEDNFRKIITQKWIGIYPNSVESWAEFRRTGYPLYDGTHQGIRPVVINNSSTIPQGQFVKRLRYIDDEINLNPNASNASLNSNQNADPTSMNERVWWDTGRYN